MISPAFIPVRPGATATSKVTTPLDHQARGDGIVDDTAALQAALTAGSVYLPPGYTFRVTSQLNVPSNRKVGGFGPQSTVVYDHDVETADGETLNLFELEDGTHDVRFEGFRVTGKWATPTVRTTTKSQNAAIHIDGTTCRDVKVSDVDFENLFGFSVHNEATAKRVSVFDCRLLNVGAGLNVNADDSWQMGNELTNSWSIESSGAKLRIVGNNIVGSLATSAAISVGGRTSAGDYGRDISVIGNTVDDTLGQGISVNDGVDGVTVTANTVSRVARHGLIVQGPFNTPKNVSITANTFLSCGAKGATADFFGVLLNEAAAVRVADNLIADEASVGTTGAGSITSGARTFTATSGFSFASADVGKVLAVVGAGPAGATLLAMIATVTSATVVTLSNPAGTTVAAAVARLDSWEQRYGVSAVSASVTGLSIADNRLANTSKDVSLTGTVGVKFRGNDYDPAKIEVLSGATIDGPPVGLVASGGYYATRCRRGSQTPTSGTVYYSPLYLDRTVAISLLGIYVSTGQAGATARVGVHADAGTGVPGALIFEATTGTQLDCSTTGNKESSTTGIAAAQAVGPGWIWLSAEVQGTAPTLIANSTNGDEFIEPMRAMSNATVAGNTVAWAQSSVNGALPAAAAVVASLGSASQSPRVYFKVA